MSIAQTLKLCIAIYLLAISIDLVKYRRIKRFVLELLPMVGLVLLSLWIATTKAGYVTFGPEYSPILVVLIMFGAIVFGIAARYIFYLQGRFYWLDFVKPLCISPILLLPLIGSIQAVRSLEVMQVVSFALLAFQNGFFWQAVLAAAKPVTQNPTRTSNAENTPPRS